MKPTPRCSRMAPRPMFSAGLTYSAKAEREDSTRQAQQARQVYACPAYSPRGFPLAQGQQGAVVARETDTQCSRMALRSVSRAGRTYSPKAGRRISRGRHAKYMHVQHTCPAIFLWFKVNKELLSDCLYRIYRTYGFYVGMLD